jgi:hypothetical protein
MSSILATDPSRVGDGIVTNVQLPGRSGTMTVVRALLAIAVTVSGLHGVVHKGPTMPVCRVGEPCTAPAQVTLVFRNTRTARTFRTRSNRQGRYRITLAAGYYAVTTAERIGITRNIRPHAVHVRRSHDDRIDFAIDTGIR